MCVCIVCCIFSFLAKIRNIYSSSTHEIYILLYVFAGSKESENEKKMMSFKINHIFLFDITIIILVD